MMASFNASGPYGFDFEEFFDVLLEVTGDICRRRLPMTPFERKAEVQPQHFQV
jgi:hypothetical protein